jgi:cytidylate kinase
VIVAIDGPAGAGKSTVARAVAARLGAGYLDTGSMYRALTWLALERGVAVGDGEALGALARAAPITLEPRHDHLRVEIGGVDVTTVIREPRVTAAVSAVSAHAEVRREIVAAQRAILAEGDWVADGRDIGTVVRPDADLKIFLTASVDERARRRAAEIAGDAAAVRSEIERRDALDTGRAESPLRPAADAIPLDTTDLTLDQVVAAVERLVAAGARGRP